MKEKIFVYGASGHAKVVIDIIEKQGIFEIACLADDNPTLKDSTFYGYHVIGGKSELFASGIKAGIVAIGSNRSRSAVAAWLTGNGFTLVSAIHPSAQLGRGVTVAGGTVIMAGALLNSDSRISCNVIINTSASVDHDCNIADDVHIAPGAILCGGVSVGAGSFVCAGATIIPNLTIGCNVIIGAGSTVIRDVPQSVIVAGCPAKMVKQY